MEVTPHLKTVLKNYQHSATKSLHGPPTGGGLLDGAEIAAPPPPSAPFAVPILAAPDPAPPPAVPDETQLHGEPIACFLVGGERRLCLPQVLNSVLRDLTLQQINQVCDRLRIYCSRCSAEQLSVLKDGGVLPPGAPSCGLITNTDAERLCSALLTNQNNNNNKMEPPPNSISFKIYHECFGKSYGILYPELYTEKQARCVECVDCSTGGGSGGGWFSPQQFVGHVHRRPENRTIHWGFDSAQWRAYLLVPDDQPEREKCEKMLDELRERFEGRVPYPAPPPPPPVVRREPANFAGPITIKRKMCSTSDIIKELPLKKQKLTEDYSYKSPSPASAGAAFMYQPPMDRPEHYIQQYLTEYRYSAFKPVTQTIKEQKMRHVAAVAAAAPTILHPERALRDRGRYERGFEPNVALAPPKKQKYRPLPEESHPNSMDAEEQSKLLDDLLGRVSSEGDTTARTEILEMFRKMCTELRAKDTLIEDLQLRNAQLSDQVDAFRKVKQPQEAHLPQETICKVEEHVPVKEEKEEEAEQRTQTPESVRSEPEAPPSITDEVRDEPSADEEAPRKSEVVTSQPINVIATAETSAIIQKTAILAE